MSPSMPALPKSPRLIHVLRGGLVAAASLSGLALHAQTAPVPGAADVQRGLTPPTLPSALPDRAPAVASPQDVSPAPVAAPGRKLLVKSLRLTGVTVLPEPHVRALLADLIGQSWTVPELQRAMLRVNRYYQVRGFPVAHAVIPVQDVRDGELEVMVLEGRVARRSLSNDSLLGDASVLRLLGEQPAGAVVYSPELERALLTLGDTPGVSRATVTLQPGEHVGETDLVVRTEPSERVQGQVDFDNHGNRYTGYWRVGAQASVNSPLGLGDQFSMRGMVTDESTRLMRLAYRLPVAARGWSVGAALSRVEYSLQREYAVLKASGWSQIGTLDIGSTLMRAPGSGLLWRAAWDHKTFEDRIAAVSPASVTSKRSDVLTATFNGYGGRGSFTHAWTVAGSRGLLNLSSAQRAADDAGARTDGDFSKLVATGNGTWAMSPGWGLYGSLYTQMASRNLDGSEKLSLGGVNGVRAYPDGEAVGDVGTLGSLELRYTLPLQPIQLAAFVDAGHIRYNRNPYLDGTEHGRSLSGAGMSVAWAPAPEVGVKVMGATRLGHSPVESEPDDARTRLWLQSTLRF
jgi:hemolysin activation/secretion protein